MKPVQPDPQADQTADQTTDHGADDEADLQTLRGLNARFIHNYVTNNVPSHDALLHPDFVYINPRGKRIERAEYLNAWAKGFDATTTELWDTRDERITLAGNTALVRATNCQTLVQALEPGQSAQRQTSMFTYTDVYVRQHAQAPWLCIQAQITPVAKPFWPDDSSLVNAYDWGVRRVLVWAK
jgi:hypothetical protein